MENSVDAEAEPEEVVTPAATASAQRSSLDRVGEALSNLTKIGEIFRGESDDEGLTDAEKAEAMKQAQEELREALSLAGFESYLPMGDFDEDSAEFITEIQSRLDKAAEDGFAGEADYHARMAAGNAHEAYMAADAK